MFELIIAIPLSWHISTGVPSRIRAILGQFVGRTVTSLNCHFWFGISLWTANAAAKQRIIFHSSNFVVEMFYFKMARDNCMYFLYVLCVSQ